MNFDQFSYKEDMRKRLENIFGNKTTSVVDFNDIKPMKIIVGLGNPGSKYAITRHNIWFLVVDELIQAYDGTELLMQKKHNAFISTGMMGKYQVLFVKPQTFMNKSGSTIQSLLNFYKLDTQDVLVIHDDIDHMFGKIKLKFAWSHGGHNGIRDTIEKLWWQKFRRLKLGVGRPSGKIDVSDYVLGNMKQDELDHWADSMRDIKDQVEQWLKNVG